jgi:uncharacterized membrane protein
MKGRHLWQFIRPLRLPLLLASLLALWPLTLALWFLFLAGLTVRFMVLPQLAKRCKRAT